MHATLFDAFHGLTWVQAWFDELGDVVGELLLL